MRRKAMGNRLIIIAAGILLSFSITACQKKEQPKEQVPEVTESPTITLAPVTETPTETITPTPEVTKEPTAEPTQEPTPEPTEEPTPEPTKEPTPEPTKEPTPEPTKEPTPEPTKEPTPEPTKEPTLEPTKELTPEPTKAPEKDPLESESLTSIMDALYKNVDAELPMVETITITSEDSEYFLGINDDDIEEAIASEPMMSSVAHSICLVRVKEGADVEAMKKEIAANIDPAKWVCVSVDAENIHVVSRGNLILVVMTNVAPDQFVSAFSSLKVEEEVTAQEITGSLESLMAKIYEGVPEVEKIPFLAEKEITKENSDFYIGVPDLDLVEGLASDSMMRTFAHTICLIRVKEGTDVEALKEEIKEKVNPARKVCVVVDKKNIRVESIGHLIYVGVTDVSPDQLKDNFLALQP